MGKYHDRINWKKELQLLPGYIIVCAWVALTAAILFWIVCASLSSTKEILTGRVMDFSNGLKWDNYVTAWNTQNVSLYFFNSLGQFTRNYTQTTKRGLLTTNKG